MLNTRDANDATRPVFGGGRMSGFGDARYGTFPAIGSVDQERPLQSGPLEDMCGPGPSAAYDDRALVGPENISFSRSGSNPTLR